MSTRLLSHPGSKHTVTDDLESHYFVLMWTALHWVKHDQPGDSGINMEHIFDQQCSLPGDIIGGGTGKIVMYGTRGLGLHEVEFACKPFNELFWNLWSLFAEYLARRLAVARKRGSDPGECSKRDVNSEMKTWTLT